MSLLWDNYQSASSGGGGGGTGPASGTVLFDVGPPTLFFQTWLYRIPHNVSSVVVEGWAGGGPGSPTPSNQPAGPGGAGGGYFKKTVSVIANQQLSGFVGHGGSPSAANNGYSTTLASPACTATGGGPGIYGGSPGTGGTATGGDVNTSGHNGGLTNAWDGGGAGNGGGDQTAQGAPATSPGGGGPGGLLPNAPRFEPSQPAPGANGRIRISVA